MHEVVAQMRNIFEKQSLMAKRNMVPQNKVLVNLAHIPDNGAQRAVHLYFLEL
jgi:hypothetical protein